MKRISSLFICIAMIMMFVTISEYTVQANVEVLDSGGSELLQIIIPTGANAASGGAYFPMGNAFDGQPQLDETTGTPVGGTGSSNAPAIADRVGYIDFGADWTKVRITSTWTQYRTSSGGNQTPYAELWWDDDTDSTNYSLLTETRINFNSAQDLSTGATMPWVRDSEVSASYVAPQARYLVMRAPSTMTDRASEYAMIGWIDDNENGVQDAPFTPVSAISVSGAGGVISVLTSETLQMSYTLTPYNATTTSVTWSVTNGTGSATISESGLLTPITDGIVTVTATAQDGSNMSGELDIAISQYSQLILPVKGNSYIYYDDIQSSFPQINWETLDRLYIPAGSYQYIKLNNLPTRTAENPLVITNYGGQVYISGTHLYTFVLGGGSNWILTGEYDEERKTGHPDFPGHANGNYVDSEGRYGIEAGRSDSSGISVSSATNFELSFMEVAYSGFAGLLIKTDNVSDATMDGVVIHDMYIHDVESEGMYIGNTGSNLSLQHTFTNLKIYNNRVIRSGTEGLQLTNMGDGLEVYNNVIALCAMGWKNAFYQWQDGCLQYSQRSGSSDIHHNVFIGGASTIFQLWLTASAEDTLDPDDEVWVHDNYFSHGRDLFSYIHNTPLNATTTLRFEDNIIRQFNFEYDELPGGRTDTNKLFWASNNAVNPLIFTDNILDGSRTFVDTIEGNNGAVDNVIATGNVTAASLDPIAFADVSFPAGFDWNKIETWFNYSDLYDGPIYYNEGDYVVYFPTGDLYLCIEPGTHSGKNPTTNPSTWQLVSPMKNDFRLLSTSPYQGIGLLEASVNVPIPEPKSITGFDFDGLDPAVTGVVDETTKTIELIVPYGTNVTALTPTITYDGASIVPGNGEAQDFTNEVIYTVTAEDELTQTYGVTVIIANPTPTPTPTPSPTSTPAPTSPGVDIIVNGKVENIGTVTSGKQGDQSILTMTVDPTRLDQWLNSKEEQSILTITANEDSNIVVGELNGQSISNMKQKQTVIEIKTGNSTYRLPAAEININALAEQLGDNIELKDITLQIEISEPTEETVQLVEDAATSGGFSIVVPAIHFEVRAVYGDQTIEVSKFNAYVERMVAIPDGVDPTKITTGIVVDVDSSYHPVPTKIILQDGQYYAVLNSLTNSIYSVVWHPIAFKDVKDHWSKASVNDLGSRMIMAGVGDGNFNPDQSITRAEFATVIVRALGLKLEGGSTPFTDIDPLDWYSRNIQTAYIYQLIDGFEDDTFHPMDMITREQAMHVISKAMQLTGLQAGLTDVEWDLTSFTDSQSISDWAYASVIDCLNAGIIHGRSDSLLAPQANISRAEVAVIIQRLLQQSDLI